ncbi:MAG: AAA family ATPase [Gammaproteobacteria bacterium]|nr:AAA family ATPase [Gammaproteobacteria bacterium]
MTIRPTDTALKLPDLNVAGFRGIEDLSISRLGRVTLFAGKNGVGKTTLLEAIQLYAARCSYDEVERLLDGREEFITAEDEDGDEVTTVDWEALFHGRHLSVGSYFSIGPRENTEQRLTVRAVSLAEDQSKQTDLLIREYASNDEIPALEIEFGSEKWELPLLYHVRSRGRYNRLPNGKSRLPPVIRCESLGPGLLDNSHVAKLWDNVALTDAENQTVQALNLLSNKYAEAERIAVIGDERPSRVPSRIPSRFYGRRAVVKLKGQDDRVPLKSLGDGATRLFGVALVLADIQDGFLVVDEVENGIHHSIQRDFWNMVIKTAHENSTQVFATTHSWDCVKGFAQAAIDSTEVEGTLIRLERSDNRIRAIEYSEDELEVAAKQHIEVR